MASCNCPNPPGGRVECPNGHVALCVVEHGKTKGSCHEVPISATAKSPKSAVLWTIEMAGIAKRGVIGSEKGVGYPEKAYSKAILGLMDLRNAGTIGLPSIVEQALNFELRRLGLIQEFRSR